MRPDEDEFEKRKKKIDERKLEREKKYIRSVKHFSYFKFILFLFFIFRTSFYFLMKKKIMKFLSENWIEIESSLSYYALFISSED